MIVYEFPLPPTVNHYWGIRGKQRYVTKRGMDFRAVVSGIVADMNQDTLNHDIELVISIFPPDRRRRDIDNFCKSLLDAMEHAGVYEDDYLVRKLTIERRQVIKGGKCCVVILKG